MVKKNFLMTAPLLMASFCSAQEKPNVVLIMVDDMGLFRYWLLRWRNTDP